MKIIDYSKRHAFVSTLRDVNFPGTGILARFLSKLIIPKPVDDIVIKTQHNLILSIFPKTDTGVERSLYYTGTYEKAILNLFSHFLKKGDTFVDIGANIGLMSIHAANLVGEKGIVYAFEPNPETIKILNKNIALNTIKSITVCPFALGTQQTSHKIYTNWHVNRGGASLIKPATNSDSFDINVIRFDAFYEEKGLQKIDLIKIDVEGFELEVLKGFGAVFTHTQPILIIECGEERGADTFTKIDVYNFVRDLNCYAIYKLKRGKERTSKLVKIENQDELPIHDNIVCIPTASIQYIPAKLFA